MLLLDYDELKRKLTRWLGSADRASDALQDTWLRLEQAQTIGPVDRPRPYLFRIAFNLGLKRHRRERETLTLDEARASLELVEDAPDPARAVEAKSELAALKLALGELSPRRREILIASRVDGKPLREIAANLGVSQRLVEMELKAALVHCASRLDRKLVQRFGPRARDEAQD